MATTRPDRVGRTRIRLARMLREHGFVLDPADLGSNDPYHGSKHFDGCSWSADVQDTAGNHARLCSWDTMGDCVRQGFSLLQDGGGYELVALADTPLPRAAGD